MSDARHPSEPEPFPSGPASRPPGSPGPLPPPPAATGEAWQDAAEPARPRRPIVAIAVVLVLALVAGVATFAVLRSDEGGASGPATSLALSFDRGDEVTYDIHMTMDGKIDLGSLGSQPLAMDMTESVGWKVLRVDEDGTATVRVSVDGVSGSVNGMPVPAGMTGRTATLRVTSDGQIISGNGLSFGATSGSGLGGFPGMDQVTPILPDHSVSPGDSWDKRFSQRFPFGDGKIEYTAHSTFERYEQVGGVRAALVTTEYEVPLDFSIDLGDLAKAFGGAGQMPKGVDATITYGGSGSFHQTSWLDLAGKQVLKTVSNGDFDMTISSPALSSQLGAEDVRMSGTFSMEMARR